MIEISSKAFSCKPFGLLEACEATIDLATFFELLLTNARDVFEAARADIQFIDRNLTFTVRAKVKVIKRYSAFCQAGCPVIKLKYVTASWVNFLP